MNALGLPYAPGTAGPESWDCGSLVQSVYGAAGISLPGDAGRTSSPSRRPSPLADVLPGDLVFLGQRGGGAGARRHRAGPEDDARRRRAGPARSSSARLPADQVLGIGRPSLGQRAPVAAPGPTGGALRMECGNTVYPPSYDGARQWGGYPNGLIPPSAMCPLGVAGHQLRCDAAAAYRAMSAAFAAAFGSPICITDSYRTYASQVRLYGEKPSAGRGAGHQQPRVGAGGRPLRRHRALRHRRSTPG